MPRGTAAVVEAAVPHSAVEFYLVAGYMSLCSLLVTVLNSLLLFLLLTKVKISRCSSCIPVVPMSVLGLIQGLSSTLLITTSLYGQLDFQAHASLCNSIAVLQNHVAIAYVANICSVALEAAWAMSHRFTYQPGHGLLYLILASVIALILPAPLSVVQLTGGSHAEIPGSPHFYLNARLKQCVKYWGAGSTGFGFYIAYSLILALLFIGCLVACTCIVQVYISKSRTEFHRSTFQDSKARKRAQDVTTAKSAMVQTLGSVVPWLPSVLSTTLLAVSGDKVHTSPHFLLETGVWCLHSLYWVAPVLCLYKNTALRRALACFRMDMAKVLRRARN